MNNIDKNTNIILIIGKKLLDNKKYDFDNIIDYFSFYKSVFLIEKERRIKNSAIKKWVT